MRNHRAKTDITSQQCLLLLSVSLLLAGVCGCHRRVHSASPVPNPAPTEISVWESPLHATPDVTLAVAQQKYSAVTQHAGFELNSIDYGRNTLTLRNIDYDVTRQPHIPHTLLLHYTKDRTGRVILSGTLGGHKARFLLDPGEGGPLSPPPSPTTISQLFRSRPPPPLVRTAARRSRT
jgi:hypothetical protein